MDSCLTLLAGIDFLSNFLLAAASADKPSALITYLTVAKNLAIVGLGLGFVIFVHELGHFLVAKACGVKCEKFYVGFDWFPLTHIGPFKIPHSLFKFQYGETEYGIGILPLGGYVKMLGQDDNPGNQAAENERIRQTGEAGPDGQEAPALDPRSFQAKSVPKRMAIICAGVAMNMLTAPFMAAAAYYFGMPYLTTDLGGTAPGSPAWIAGIEPGEKIIRIGKDGNRSEKLRFDFDVPVAAAMAGSTDDVHFLLRERDGKTEREVSVRPTVRVHKKPSSFLGMKVGGISQPMVGVRKAESLKFTSRDADFSMGSVITPAPELNDEITQVDGHPVEKSWQLMQYLALRPDKEVVLTVKRPASEEGMEKKPEQTLELRVAPLLVRSPGFTVEPKGIAAIRPGSPADKAGFKVGDIIEAVDGEPVEDPLRLTTAFTDKTGKSVDVKVRRDQESLTLSVTPDEPLQYSMQLRMPVDNGFGIEPIGVSYGLTQKVAKVESETPDGLLPGDELTSVEFTATDEKVRAKLKEAFGGTLKFDLDANNSWASFVLAQGQLKLPEGIAIRLSYRRGDAVRSTDIAFTESKSWYSDDRQLPLQIYQETNKASSLGEGLTLGFREAKEKLILVFRTVGMLVSGKASLKDTSGPAGIATMAYNQAGGGIPRFLMFLTLISVNLAVMNMLPIPVLDGGHMVFLTYEWLRGKPVDETWQIRLSVGGLLLLLSLMVFATMNDLTRFFM